MISEKTKIKNKWFYPAVISLLILFIIQFVNLSKIFFFSSLFRLRDLRNNAAEVFFLFKYGLHHTIPNFYNGLIVLFLLYPPGWAFFNLPLLYFFNLTTSMYIAIISVYILGFISSILIARYAQIGWQKGFFFFVLFFMNPIMFDYVFYIGRFPELFAWMIYTFLLAMVLKYKKSFIDFKGGILICILLASLLLAHPYVSPFGILLVLLLFLTKGKNEKIKISFILLLAFLLSSFWLVPFFKAIIHPPNTIDPIAYQKGELLNLNSLFSFNTIVIFLWWFLFYFYWKTNKKSKENKLFFYPILFLSFLVFFRISPLLPILNKIPPNAYNLFFLSWSLILLFKTNYSPKAKKLVSTILILIPVFASIFVFLIRADSKLDYNYTPTEQEVISLFSKIDDKFVIINEKGLHHGWEFSYAAIYYNLSTPQGFYPPAASQSILNTLEELDNNIKDKNCENLKMDLRKLNVKFLLAINNCEFLKKCGFEELEKKERVCLYHIS